MTDEESEEILKETEEFIEQSELESYINIQGILKRTNEYKNIGPIKKRVLNKQEEQAFKEWFYGMYQDKTEIEF